MTDIPNPDSLRPGDLVGPWCVEGYAGRGTYGVVYRARRAGHPGSLPVALKMALYPGDARFVREVGILTRVHHPGVPRLIDRGWWHASAEVVHPYLVMEWIRGLPLYRWARVHSASQRQVLRVVAQVAWGMEVVHRAGCLHRDAKGENLLVEPEGRALLTGCGSGSEVAEAAESVAEHAGGEADVPLFSPEPQAPVAVIVPVQWSPQDVVPQRPASEAIVVPARELKLGGEDWPAPEFLDVPVQEEAWVSEPKSSGHSRLLPGVAAAASVLLAVGILWGSRDPHIDAPQLARAEALDDGSAPDAGTRGLGDSTPTARVAAEELPFVLDAKVIAMELPDDPLPGQRRAPCRGNFVEINGGCWHLMTNMLPPCGDDAYEWKGACYYPIFDRVKPRTSKQPQ